MRRVVVTGFGALSPMGHDWPTVLAALRKAENVVQQIPRLGEYEGMLTKLGAPVAPYKLDEKGYGRKQTRSMGKVAVMAVRASDIALRDAGLFGDPVLKSGRVGVSYGSCSGSPEALADFERMFSEKTTAGITANTYLKMMPHTAPVNIGVYFGLTGRVLTTSSACTSGSAGIGHAFEAIRWGAQDAMLAGGSEEFDPTQVAIFDTLFATSTSNDSPKKTPRPFDTARNGLVIGEGAGTLILEELEHAKARGAKIYAELVGFGTNSDGTHVTNPQASTMAHAMRLALQDAKLSPDAIGYVNAHGTATPQGDIAESTATHQIFGERMPISSLKSYMGHTLGACGALEAWMTIEMMREGWVCPTVNLDNVDPKCGALDYVRGEGRNLQTEFVMTNNFAFGGINTSIIFRRWP
ncbi:MAG: beta-ketoacyl-ACP synthase [Archangium sp.]|nr:beta-ketoacyl-ACP synthase [Archangium sp.]